MTKVEELNKAKEVAIRLNKECSNLLDEEQLALFLHMILMRDFTPPTDKGRAFVSNICNMLKSHISDSDHQFLQSYFSI